MSDECSRPECQRNREQLKRLRTFFGDDLDPVWVEVVTDGMKRDRRERERSLLLAFWEYLSAPVKMDAPTRSIDVFFAARGMTGWHRCQRPALVNGVAHDCVLPDGHDGSCEPRPIRSSRGDCRL